VEVDVEVTSYMKASFPDIKAGGSGLEKSSLVSFSLLKELAPVTVGGGSPARHEVYNGRVEVLSGDASTSLLNIDESPMFSSRFKGLRNQCYEVIRAVHSFLYEERRVGVVKYVLDVYTVEDKDAVSYIPYIEIHVNVANVDELLRLWRDVVEFIEHQFGGEILKRLDVFLTRATQL
jgi:hypothetical protein